MSENIPYEEEKKAIEKLKKNFNYFKNEDYELDDKGHVIKINLNDKGVNGIHDFLKVFSYLEDLDLGNPKDPFVQNAINKIENLDNLHHLKKLNLVKNEIDRIQGIENLKNLKYLNLGYNWIAEIQRLD